jgi:hypothetical protein
MAAGRADALEPGHRLHVYSIAEVLGSGGFGMAAGALMLLHWLGMILLASEFGDGVHTILLYPGITSVPRQLTLTGLLIPGFAAVAVAGLAAWYSANFAAWLAKRRAQRAHGAG